MTANSLANFQPHAPTAEPYADTWYYYLNDPAVGYLKIVFLTYLNGETDAGRQNAYVHVAHAPIRGTKREHDHYFHEVIAEPVANASPAAFRFEVPGAVSIDEAAVSLTLPGVSVDAAFAGPHHHYFDAPDPTASPFFGPMESLPSEQSHWFVYTLGSPVEYRYREAGATHEGRGLMYAERGWSTRQAHGFCYLMAVSEEAKVMLVCGTPDDIGEVWAGRLVTARHDLTFLPFADGQTVTSELDSAGASARVTIGRDPYEVRAVSRASLADFYDQVTPSLTVFEADRPVAKTMNAALDIEVLEDGHVVETVALPQSILEFGGVLYPPASLPQTSS